MSVVRQIDRFRRLNAEIESAVQTDDLQAVRDLDAAIVSEFDSILSAGVSESERAEVVAFLLDVLKSPSSRSEKDKKICEKILRIVSGSSG